MGVLIKWKPVTGATKITLYQSKQPFEGVQVESINATTPGTITATVLDGTITEHEVTMDRNTYNYFVTMTEDAEGNKAYGQSFNVGNYPNTGPGPQKLIRGDWEFGYFGEVPVADMFTAPALAIEVNKNPISSKHGYENADSLTVYNKCVVWGRILFIPNTWLMLLNGGTSVKQTFLQNLGLYGGPAVNPVVNKDGWDFRVRLPYSERTGAWGLKPNISRDELIRSELGMIIGLDASWPGWSILSQTPSQSPSTKMFLNDTGNSPTTDANSKWVNIMGSCWGETQNATTLAKVWSYQPRSGIVEGYMYFSTGSNYQYTHFMPVLELLF